LFGREQSLLGAATKAQKDTNNRHTPNNFLIFIIEGSMEAVSTVFEAWRSSPVLVTAGSSSRLGDDESDITSLSLDDHDMKDDDDDYFCPLPDPFSARNHWGLLSPDMKLDSSLKQYYQRPPCSSLVEIPPLSTSPVTDPRRRTRPCCLFINYLGTRLPRPKAESSRLQGKEPTSTPTAAPTSNSMPTSILVNPADLTKKLRTREHPRASKRKNKQPPPSTLNLKVPIHLTNLKVPTVRVKKAAVSSKKEALPAEPVKSIFPSDASERTRNKKQKSENITI
jgi:hypothetical protein